MYYDENGNSWIAESSADFDGWDVINIIPWKPGVHQVIIRKPKNNPAECRMVFTSDEHLPLLGLAKALADLRKAFKDLFAEILDALRLRRIP